METRHFGPAHIFSYNCSVPWPQEQFSQGKLCQGSLGSTATSNPCSASPTGQLNLAEQSQSLLLRITEKKSPSQHRQPLSSDFSSFFSSQAAQLSSSGSPLISLSWLWGFNTVRNLHSSDPCFPPFHSADLTFVPLSVSLAHCTISWYCPKKAAGWGEMIWISSLQNSLKRDWLVLRTLNSLIKNAAG